MRCIDRSELDHAKDLVEESQEESNDGEGDHDGHHRDDQIEEQRKDRNNAVEDRGQVCCKVKCHFGYLKQAGVALL